MQNNKNLRMNKNQIIFMQKESLKETKIVGINILKFCPILF
jgi:hypothetical protein